MSAAKTFEQWWGENEKQYGNDACHMSEYHMASVVWNAAIKESALVCKNRADHAHEHDEGLIGSHLEDAANGIQELALSR